MSEVKRYTESCGEGGGVVEHRNGELVSIKDFDRVTAECHALQQRLTAEHERADVLEGLLREVVALDPRGEFFGWQLDGRIDEVLQRAEVVGDE